MAEASSLIVAGQYEIGERIRQDALSTLFAARDIKNNRKVWVKLLSPSLAKDKQFVEQFQQEAKMLAGLKSPQIPQVIDVGTDGDTCYIVMEASAGKTLAAILREEGTLEVEPVLKIAEQVAWCLYALGQKGLVHRGINPGNILITPAEEVVVMDFGLARGASTAGISFTEVSAIPDYVSPEQVEGGQEIDIKSDIYALGIMIYAMLAGEVPYRGNSPMDIIIKHLSAPIPSLRAVRPDTPPEVDALVKRCLAKAPRDRYQTPAELINAIYGAMGLRPAGLPAATPAPPPPPKTEKVVLPVAPAPAPAPAPAKKRSAPPKAAKSPPPAAPAPAPAKKQSAPPKAAKAAKEPPPVAPAPAPAKEQAAPPEEAELPSNIKTEEVEALPPVEKRPPPVRKAPILHVPNIRCPQCSQVIPANERFCPRCGRLLSVVTPPPAGPVETTPSKGVLLVVRAGRERGQTFTLEAETRLGRGSGNDVALSDPKASRRHSQITRHGSQYVLVDLGSSNGTFVNNRRIEGAYVLKDGDVIKLGETEIVIRL